MPRVVIPEAEELLDKEIPCLDKGFVRLVDYMGGDSRIVQSARVSYGEGTKTVREDKGLINYLMKNDHTSPFEQVSFTFHCKMPIFVARQWVRHRTARLNEISARYSVMKDEFYLPEPEQVRLQSKSNKQGRSDETIPLDAALALIEKWQKENRETYEHYEEMLEAGLARELARINLPVSLYTEWYWSIDLHNLFHFIQLRADAHAQYEIRVYAEALAKCARAVSPLAFEAFEEHRMYAIKFSRTECRALAAILEGREPEMEEKTLMAFRRKLESLGQAPRTAAVK
jgi:thymidylate synthase (FAD)